MEQTELGELKRRVLRLVFAVLVMPLLGWLLGATIINAFTDRYGPDPAPRPGQTFAIARECDRHGPVSTHGFGFWHQCMADLGQHDGPFARRPVNFLTPADIGQHVPVVKEGTGRRSHHVRAADQPLAWWGWLALPFALGWLYLTYLTARPVLRKIKAEVDADDAAGYQRPTEEPSRDVVVSGGRKMWLGFKGHLIVLVLAVVPAVRSTPWAFGDYPNHTALAVGGWAVVLLVVGNWVRRAVFMPSVTISPEGMAWGRTKLGWAEIGRVHLTRANTLVIEPRTGETTRIRRFGDEQATRIHVAMGHFATVPYTREGQAAPPEALSEPEPVADELPSGEVSVISGGRKPWLRGGWLVMVLVIAGSGATLYTTEIVGGSPKASSYGLVCWAVLLVIAGDRVRRWKFAPEITASPEGLAWRRGMLSWQEISRVHLSRGNVVSIQPVGGELAQIGPFGDEQADQVHGALLRFARAEYTREGSPAVHGSDR
ncbi:hypothetical protein FKR81_17410 [Lentzea tibetensis]|uniref:Uncharacterized protein n=1 Tax=Lentzea tibetensis TaxID=2591470 RepID=A0A563ET08_9PSEU|nr:DUF6346 domain-containing protein [Lentzea tibetensis]TWP50865.1 hypothetical protein FKR81_17410 [Lentzea tibetensis]